MRAGQSTTERLASLGVVGIPAALRERMDAADAVKADALGAGLKPGAVDRAVATSRGMAAKRGWGTSRFESDARRRLRLR